MTWKPLRTICLVLGVAVLVGPPVVRAQSVQTGGSLVIARSADSNFLDPGFTNIQENIDVLGNIYEGLVKLDPQGKVEPWLAKSWTISDDGKVYTFTLRDGVQFQDGTPMDADAVAISFQRHFKESKYFQYKDRASSLQTYLGDALSYSGIQVIDPHTVRFTLNYPYADFLNVLTLTQAGSIVSPTALEKYGEAFAQHPVGTGPFELQNWVHGDHITLAANKDYWGDGPYLDRVVFKVVPDVSARIVQLIGGDAQVIENLLPDQIKTVQSHANLKLIQKPSLSYGAMVINVTKEPFGDVRVRQAINYAINKDAIVKNLMGDVATRTYSPMPPLFPCYDANVNKFPYDPAKAKQLLAAAGYPNGFDTELWTFSFARYYIPNAVSVAEAIQSDLKQVGINAKLTVFDGASYWDKVNHLQGHLLIAGWGASPAMDTYMRVSVLKESKNGFGDTPEGKKLLDLAQQAETTTQLDQRCQIYDQMQEQLVEASPTVILNNSKYMWGTAANVHGVEINPQGLSDLRTAWIGH